MAGESVAVNIIPNGKSRGFDLCPFGEGQLFLLWVDFLDYCCCS